MNVALPEKVLDSMTSQLKSSDINILIVGETGVGKSTFVNAFANYISFPSLQDAAKSEDIISVIPSNFSVMDDNFETRVIKFGEDKNECDKPGSSATIDAKMYRIPYGEERSVILIDTPGVGDTNGIETDEKNLQNLLTQIAEFRHLHAILILLKPNDSRVSVLFKYCIKQLLSSLEKSASLNIVFLFTNSRGTFYKPGDTAIPLRAVLKEIEDAPPFVRVPFNKTNTFCVDNEAFRFLIAKKNNIGFTDDETKEFGESWNRSANEINKMLKYIQGLSPHKIQDTVSVNTSRTLIIRLSKPLAEISQNITDNIKRLEEYCRMRDDKSLWNLELLKKLNVKRIGLKINPIDKPMTVCADKACVSVYSVDGSTAVRYNQICHKICRVKGAQKEQLGDARLTRCIAMAGGNCREKTCGHSYRTHMHIYYVSEPYEYEDKDETISKDIKTNEEAQLDIAQKMEKINRDLEEYKYEQDVIQDAMAKFAHFIKHHAITPINDAYKAYILYFIDVQKNMGQDADRVKIKHFERLIAEYEERVNLLEHKLTEEKTQNVTGSAVSSADIEDLKNLMCLLPLYGKTIKEALVAQTEAQQYNQIEITEVKPKKWYKWWLS